VFAAGCGRTAFAATHPQRKAIAIGHAMRKLLHLVFAIGKSGQPFDATHDPWGTPAQGAGEARDIGMSLNAATSNIPAAPEEQAAGHKRTVEPARKVVTAACTDTVSESDAVGEGTAIDFGHLKQQLPLARGLDHLGLTGRLRGTGPQRRCTCPIHRGDARGRTFSVNLEENVFQCFERSCGKKGDAIDLWASVRGRSLREAALDLVRTFHLEPSPR